jgi:murein L,D-transpeptidase YcbB/YkuD
MGLTGWANDEGIVSFRDDVYGVDTIGEATANAASVVEGAASPAIPALVPGR